MSPTSIRHQPAFGTTDKWRWAKYKPRQKTIDKTRTLKCRPTCMAAPIKSTITAAAHDHSLRHHPMAHYRPPDTWRHCQTCGCTIIIRFLTVSVGAFVSPSTASAGNMTSCNYIYTKKVKFVCKDGFLWQLVSSSWPLTLVHLRCLPLVPPFLFDLHIRCPGCRFMCRW